MSNFIITVENIYKKDYLIPREDVAEAVKDAMEVAVEHMRKHLGGGFAVANLYIRPEAVPENMDHRFASISVEERKERICPECTCKEGRCCDNCCGEDCDNCCGEDCDNCPFDNICDLVEPDPDASDDENDEIPNEVIMGYLNWISEQVANLASRFEKVCKAIPKEGR